MALTKAQPIPAHRPHTPYEENRDYVLAVLARRCSWLDPSDREALFHDAYAVLLEKQATGQLDVSVMRGPQVRAYLTQTALNKAMDEGKRAGRRRSVSLDDENLGIDPADPQRDLDEQLAARFEDARVREIVAELPERQQLIIRLRFFLNRTPFEIQQYMGVTERVYRRELERATHRLAERFQLMRAGTFCDSRRSLLLAYVTGVAGPNRAQDARRHLESCPACATWVLELRAATRRTAAFVPAPVLALPLAGSRLLRGARAVHHQAAHMLVSARGHATRFALRADPSRLPALASVRPSAVAVIVTGCLAAGSSATYCAVHGLPAPIRSLIGVTGTRRAHVHAKATHLLVKPAAVYSGSHASAASAPPVVPLHLSSAATTTPRAAPPAASRAKAQSRTVTGGPPRTRAGRVHAATDAEFGLAQGSPTSSPAPAATTTARALVHSSVASAVGSSRNQAPAPAAPSSPSREFDP